jgi:mannose-6-phosphate isomerase
MTAPIVLAPNLPETFYAGSGRLARFRDADVPNRPEEWLASTTRRFGQGDSGLTVLPGGGTLLDAVTADPMGWLGHRDPDTGVLVKLLDAGQRLPLHVHPDRTFARSHLASPYGKTEAWIVLDAAPDAQVNLGFNRDVAADELAAWVRDQDVAAMLAATNSIPIHAGDAVLCPAGTPHAIGAGVLLIELQEPTDFSIMLETDGFPIAPDDALLGLPFDAALQCVTRSAASPGRLREWSGAAPGSLLPAQADPFFRARRARAGETVRGFAVLVVTDGTGTLAGRWGGTPIRSGTVLVLPFGAGPARIDGSASLVVCRPAQRS